MSVGLPRDAGEWAAVAAALAILAVSRAKRFASWGSARAFRAASALLAAGLSALYVVSYLRGGPRIIDATTYYLEGRALAEGHLAWSVGDLPTATMGRFLVRDVLASGDHAAAIFPPGYPALLALGFLVHAPLAVGPLLAACVTWLTYDLGEEVAARLPSISPLDRALVPRIAATLSVVCAALRYHTADTMSHGLAAALVTAALVCALRLRGDEDAREAPNRRAIGLPIALGLALGWLAATRPVSGIAAAALAAITLGRRGVRLRTIALALAGAAPPLALLVLHQRAATGAWLTSSQSLYYALSDGPAGCFAYGFGPRIGCRLEHGDFVEHNLRAGYGAFAALATTARRLKMHLVDALNAQPLAAVTAWGIGAAARRRETRALALSLPLFALAYAPFYFDGNYPGGGARFFADQLPVEHVLVAAALPALARAKLFRRLDTARLGASVTALALVGFALFAGKDHALLRDREGGRPMFEPRVLEAAGVERGLVFVDTDHGFDLGFDPDAMATRGVQIARRRGDASDRWLWEALGRPPTYRYDYAFDPDAPERAAVKAFEPPASHRLEAESLWPPVAQKGGYVEPAFHPCASAGRWLRFVPDGEGPGVTLALPRRAAGAILRIRIFASVDSKIQLQVEADGAEIARFDETSGERAEGPCGDEVRELPAVHPPKGAAHVGITFRGEGHGAGVDAVRVEESR